MPETRKKPLVVLALLLVSGAILAFVFYPRSSDEPLGPLDRTHLPAAEASPPVLMGSPAAADDAPQPTPEPPREELEQAPLTGAYVIQGTVKDIETGEALVGAEVTGTWIRIIPKNNQSTTTEPQEVRADVLDGGRFRLVIEGAPPPPIRSLSVADRSWQVIRVGPAEAGGEATATMPRPREGATADVTVWVRRVFFIQGMVQDSRGSPLRGVRVSFRVPMTRYDGHMSMGRRGVHTDERGQFEIGPFAYNPKAGIAEASWEYMQKVLPIVFTYEGFATFRVDPLDVPADQRDWYIVTLSRGVNLAGVALDPWGRPLAGVPVVAEYGDAWDLRRGVRTDAEGRWRLENLTPGKATLAVRAFSRDLKARREMTISEDDDNVELLAESVALQAPPATTRVLGLGLAEVTDEIRRAYDVPDYVHVIILDPGDDPTGLGIGRLEKGYGIYYVGHEKVSTVRQVVEQLIEVSSARDANTRGRVVYTFWNERMSGTNTQHVRLSQEQVEGLKRLLEKLPQPVPGKDADAK